MKHTYFALRHGEAEHIVRGVVASRRPDVDTTFPLTEKGMADVETSVAGAIHSGVIDTTKPLVVIASPVLRARQTGDIAIQTAMRNGVLLKEGTLQIRDAWADRDFGSAEGGPNTVYEQYWKRDKQDPLHHWNSCESAAEVRKRIEADLTELEHMYDEPCQILLCSHGDTLQITQTFFLQMGPEHHRDVPHIHTAEIRRLY